MRNLMRVFSLSAALLLAGPALPATAANPPAGTALPDRLGELLRDLEQDQALRLTRSAGDREARFSAARPEQVLQSLSGAGALVLLGTRGARENAPLTLNRALRVSGDRLNASATAVRAAYVLNRPAEADLSGLLGQMLAQGRLGTSPTSPALESITAAAAIEAVNGWKGVRFIADVGSSPGPPDLVLKRLYLIPDTIRISIIGDAVVPAASVSETRGAPDPLHRQRSPIGPDPGQRAEQIEEERAEQEKMQREHAEWREMEQQRVEKEEIEREQMEREEMEKERMQQF